MNPGLVLKGALVCLGLLAISCSVPVDDMPRAAKLQSLELKEATDLVRQPQKIVLSPPEFPIIPSYYNTLYFTNFSMNSLIPITRSADERSSPEELLELLLKGPAYDEAMAVGVKTFLPDYDQVRDTSITGNELTIEFAPNTDLKQLAVNQLHLAIGQLVLTMTFNTHVTSVLVKIDGIMLELPTSQGNVIRPLAFDDYSDLSGLLDAQFSIVTPRSHLSPGSIHPEFNNRHRDTPLS